MTRVFAQSHTFIQSDLFVLPYALAFVHSFTSIPIPENCAALENANGTLAVARDLALGHREIFDGVMNTVVSPEIEGQALQAAGISKPDFVFLFATVGYPQQVLLKGNVIHEIDGRPALGY